MIKKLHIFFFTFCLSLSPAFINGQINVIEDFDIANGTYPEGSLVLSGSTLYGMTSYGGANNYGTIFSVSVFGTSYTDLHDFNDTLGATPYGSLTLSGVKLFGMAWRGGIDSAGCIFSMNINGSGYKVLLNFDSANGAYPHGDLLLSGGKLFGMTSRGGLHDSGRIFSIDTNGNNYKVLYDFKDSNAIPYGSLILSGGRLFGMTSCGKFDSIISKIDTMLHDTTYRDTLVYDSGSVFAIDTNGKRYRTIQTFYGGNGETPWGNLTLSGKTLFGMTSHGGTFHKGCLFRVDTNGGRYSRLLNFDGADTLGSYPHGSLTRAGAILYGMTGAGRLNNQGGIFSIDTDGTKYTNLANFNDSDGANPFGSLLLSSGQMYGMTQYGGRNNVGVVFACNQSGAGITELSTKSEEVRVYPNPSSGKFYVRIDNGHGTMNDDKQSIQIYNMLGKEVFSQFSVLHGTFSIDLSNTANGIYFYRVVSTNGDIIGEGKLVIQK